MVTCKNNYLLRKRPHHFEFIYLISFLNDRVILPIIQVKVNCKKNQIGNLSCKTICSNIYKEILAGILHYIYPHQEYLISPPYPPSYITFTSERMVIKTSFMKLFNIYYYSLWVFFVVNFVLFLI